MRTGATPSSGSSNQISATIGRPEVEAFLTHLAVDRGLAVSGHRQALSALLFLQGQVRGHQRPWTQDIGRPVREWSWKVVLVLDEAR